MATTALGPGKSTVDTTGAIRVVVDAGQSCVFKRILIVPKFQIGGMVIPLEPTPAARMLGCASVMLYSPTTALVQLVLGPGGPLPAESPHALAYLFSTSSRIRRMNAMAWGLVSPVSVCRTLLRPMLVFRNGQRLAQVHKDLTVVHPFPAPGFPSRISRTAWSCSLKGGCPFG